MAMTGRYTSSRAGGRAVGGLVGESVDGCLDR